MGFQERNDDKNLMAVGLERRAGEAGPRHRLGRRGKEDEARVPVW